MINVKWMLRSLPISALMLGTGVFSAAPAQVVQADKTKVTEGRAASEAQKVAVDPQTGKLRQPTPDEDARLGESMRKAYGRAATALEVKYHDNGMISAQLPEDYMEVSVLKINPDGSTSRECVTGMRNAETTVLEWANSQPQPQAGKANLKIGPKAQHRVARKAARKEWR